MTLKMKKNLIFFTLLFLIGWGQAQSKLSPVSQRLSTISHGKSTLIVTLSSVADFAQIPDNVKNTKASIPYLIPLLQKEHQSDIESLKSFAEQESIEISILSSYWISNAAVIEIKNKKIEQLINCASIRFVEEINEVSLEHHKPISMQPTKQVNGTEPGLLAVKADTMWSLGYTGKGKKLLCFDTGIWPDHPALKGRFMGDRTSLSESWYGLDFFSPADKNGSHGTHTTGTVLGLDTNTKDTIGLAIQSYFIAADPISQGLAGVRPPTDLMAVFEWALNPDGDITTTEDVPDVINNSWGRPFEPWMDSLVCNNGMYVTLLEAVEMAGIVSIQSAGNSGPGSGTVGMPACANPSQVNNFSVGAVSVNSGVFNIASFSSRGPSPCGGAFSVKPEVVAPGVAVRSAVRNSLGDYEYDLAQGTSMAGPHVSGAALLLMEAFPMATSIEIKEALYFSADDLGDPGEDNVYGMGMINLANAYQYLLNSYVPASTTNIKDVELLSFGPGTPNQLCESNQLNIGVDAFFTDSIQGTELEVWVEFEKDGQIDSQQVNLGGQWLYKNEQIQMGLHATPFDNWQEVRVSITPISAAGWNEKDLINNKIVKRFFKFREIAHDHQSNFDLSLWHADWMFVNPDDRIGWDTVQNLSIPGGDVSGLKMSCYSYTPRSNQLDAMISPVYFTNNGYAQLIYSYSSLLRTTHFKDSLKVFVKEECGGTWELVKTYDVDDLNTGSGNSSSSYRPLSENDWETDTLEIQLPSNVPFQVKFETVNGGGNNIYLGNIQFVNGIAGVSSMKDLSSVNIYPNPAKDWVIVDLQGVYEYRILDVHGRILQAGKNGGEPIQLSFPKGVYLIELIQDSVKLVERLVIE